VVDHRAQVAVFQSDCRSSASRNEFVAR
jgi:hypothetical protein